MGHVARTWMIRAPIPASSDYAYVITSPASTEDLVWEKYLRGREFDRKFYEGGGIKAVRVEITIKEIEE